MSWDQKSFCSPLRILYKSLWACQGNDAPLTHFHTKVQSLKISCDRNVEMELLFLQGLLVSRVYLKVSAFQRAIFHFSLTFELDFFGIREPELWINIKCWKKEFSNRFYFRNVQLLSPWSVVYSSYVHISVLKTVKWNWNK